MQERRAVTAQTAGRYQQAGKKEKGLILAEFVKSTEYARAYAKRVLRNHGKRLQVDQQRVLVADVRKRWPRSKRPQVYDEKVVAALIKNWKIMDYICGKRLQPVMAELVTVLERHTELSCDPQTRAKLLRISAATIDRLLKPERRKYELRGRSRTKPGLSFI